MKRFLTFAAGLLAYFFLEGFIRLIIMFYHRADFYFYGVSHLPDKIWIIVILAAVLVNTWLICMMILSILKSKPKVNAVAFCLVLLFWRAFEIFNSYQLEPKWYFVVVSALHIIGAFLAYQLFTRQHEIPTHS